MSNLNMSQSKSIVQPKNVTEIQQWLINWLSEELEFDASNVNIQEPFVNFGLSSRQALSVAGDLENWLGLNLEPTLIWEYPTIQDLSEYLAQLMN
jgi:acyl carrier protein